MVHGRPALISFQDVRSAMLMAPGALFALQEPRVSETHVSRVRYMEHQSAWPVICKEAVGTARKDTGLSLLLASKLTGELNEFEFRNILI